MKQTLLLTAVLGLAVSAHATLFSYDYSSLNAAIPDGSSVGLADSRTVNLGALTGTTTTEIVNVNVRLDITGGYNGDLYGYLMLQNANGTTTAILLNRVGRNAAADYGYSTAGFGNITLSGNTGTDIHLASGSTDGNTYRADGRTLNPTGDFTGANGTPGTATLTVLNGQAANGTWTLFLADMAGGDQSTLVSWGLDITVVPEPASWALLVFAAGLGIAVVSRRLCCQTA